MKLHSQRELRAGIKVVHKCTVLIGEFKSLFQSRSGIGHLETGRETVGENMLGDIIMDDVNGASPNKEPVHPSDTGIKYATRNLMYYVSAYFLTHPLCFEIIALASSGPFWKWGLIQRDEAVDYDWLSQISTEDDENGRLIAAFNDRFLRSNVYLLATPTSDAQINLMTREMKRIAGQCDPTFRNNLPTALNFQLLPDCPRRCATCDV